MTAEAVQQHACTGISVKLTSELLKLLVAVLLPFPLFIYAQACSARLQVHADGRCSASAIFTNALSCLVAHLG